MADKKLTALQEEIKLLKGEVKQSLASVRDYLLNMELPSSEISTILAALGGDGEQKISFKGSFDAPSDKPPAAAEEPEETCEESMEPDEPEGEEPDDVFGLEESEEISGGDPFGGSDHSPVGGDNAGGDGPAGDGGGFEDAVGPAEDEFLPQDLDSLPEEDLAGLEEVGEIPGEETVIDEEEPMEYNGMSAAEPVSTIPKVNMMANLINWVSRAKQEIGYDNLPTFLEVYGISGHLAPEMKDVILHLAEITEERPETETSAGIWSEHMLSLHGILTGGESPLHPVIPSWSTGPEIEDQITEEEIIEEAAPQPAPVRLKLVFPNGNGVPKEYCIDLAPESDTGPDRKNRTEN